MNARSVIATRRDGRMHSREELEFLAQGAAAGTIPDYQLSAWLMAAFLNPLSEQETADLTVVMAGTGEQIDLSGLPKPWVDKHSTGGVGDKTTVVLLPLLAACGLTVVKMSGRGLGITGGTVDKLESVPGFRMDLSPAEMKEQAARIGLAITGQTADLAPADKVLYALRDAIGAVENIPLIASSILSKKLAGGAEAVVFDVKAGSGAFMKTRESAEELAGWLNRTGERVGLRTRAVVTDMEVPLGRAVGNALEVAEAIEVLAGKAAGPSLAVRDLCIRLAGVALAQAGVVPEDAKGAEMACVALDGGKALDKTRAWFEAQGAPAGFVDDPRAFLPQAPVAREVVASVSGRVVGIDAGAIGRAVIELGGGRNSKEDLIDPSVGIEFTMGAGVQVATGEPIARISARSDSEAETCARALLSAVRIS